MTKANDTRRDAVWQGSALAGTYLDGVRGAIPLAAEQITILVHLAQAACPSARAMLDLGCGDGILGHALLDQFAAKEPTVVLADFSAPMLDAARERFGDRNGVWFVEVDYGQIDWANLISSPPLPGTYDVVVSGFSIHHQTDADKRRIYKQIFDLLTPGGIFLNLEHVASATRWGEQQFEEYFIESLYRFHAQRGKNREQVAADFYHRPDKDANLLAPVEVQCEWLREIGFTDVDCFFKVFELALFGGIRPADRG